MPAADPIGERPPGGRPLAGRRIAVLEHREQDRLGGMLEAQGARTLRCPLVAIADAPDPAPVLAWLERFVDTPPDDFVLMTGEGLRRLRGFADRAGLDEAFRGALGQVRTITRGPKPAQALREISLTPGLRAERPTSEGVGAALARNALRGRRVALQLYPDAPATLVDFLKDAGARPDPVWPYAYLPAAGDTEVLGLIEEMAAGRVDAVAFTSAVQIVQLFETARGAGAEPQLRAALACTTIAAIGPVVAAELERRGLCALIMPRDTYFMKPLVSAIAAALSR
jgi:uroporphyrinogen-III synthase